MAPETLLGAPPPQIFSRRRRIAALERAMVRQSERDAARYVLQEMIEDVLERLEFMRLTPRRALVIGDWTGTLALSLGGAGTKVESGDVRTIDEERPHETGRYDLVVSLASLDRVNDLPGALLHLRGALAPGGIMIATMVGAGSLPHLRRAMLAAEPERPAPRMHPLIDSRAAAGLLQRAGFTRQVVDGRTMTVAYSSLDRLVSDLRDQGFGNALRNPAPALDRQAMERARAAFLSGVNGQGRVEESFEIITLTGWKT